MKKTQFIGLLAGIVIGSIDIPPVMAEGSRQQATVIVPESSRSSYESWGYAPAVVVGNVVYVSGVVSFLEGEGSYEERYARGFESALLRIDAILSEAGGSLDDVLDISTFHTDLQRQLMPAINKRMATMAKPHPAWTAVGTTALATPDGVTEIKVVAHLK